MVFPVMVMDRLTNDGRNLLEHLCLGRNTPNAPALTATRLGRATSPYRFARLARRAILFTRLQDCRSPLQRMGRPAGLNQVMAPLTGF